MEYVPWTTYTLYLSSNGCLLGGLMYIRMGRNSLEDSGMMLYGLKKDDAITAQRTSRVFEANSNDTGSWLWVKALVPQWTPTEPLQNDYNRAALPSLWFWDVLTHWHKNRHFLHDLFCFPFPFHFSSQVLGPVGPVESTFQQDLWVCGLLECILGIVTLVAWDVKQTLMNLFKNMPSEFGMIQKNMFLAIGGNVCEDEDEDDEIYFQAKLGELLMVGYWHKKNAYLVWYCFTECFSLCFFVVFIYCCDCDRVIKSLALQVAPLKLLWTQWFSSDLPDRNLGNLRIPEEGSSKMVFCLNYKHAWLLDGNASRCLEIWKCWSFVGPLLVTSS